MKGVAHVDNRLAIEGAVDGGELPGGAEGDEVLDKDGVLDANLDSRTNAGKPLEEGLTAVAPVGDGAQVGVRNAQELDADERDRLEVTLHTVGAGERVDDGDARVPRISERTR